MKLSEELQERGFIYQCSTESVSTVLDDGSRTVYLGIDPTADAIHVGNLVPYMLLTHLKRAGHRVILLIGGGTALIGDPGGKNEERPFVDSAVVAEQAQKLEVNVRQFVPEDVTFVNNHEWLSQLSMVTFLRDVGKHFTVNSMIKKDIVANRLTEDNSISFTEFSYSLLQAYDYYHLHQAHGCDLQIGGSDQWSNIIAGVEYIRKTTGATVYGLTMPLVVDKTTGKKFGKSEGNAVWLDPKKTSPFAFYQFWLNTSDESVIDYLKLFTLLDLDAITEIENEFQANPGARSAQKRLAHEVTTFVHGAAAAESAQKVSAILFGTGALADLAAADIAVLKENAPSTPVSDGMAIVDVLVESGLAASKREARTFIESGAIELAGKRVENSEYVLTSEDLALGLAILKRGKKQLSVLVVAE